MTPTTYATPGDAQQRFFPLTLRDCQVLSAILDHHGVFDDYGYPSKPLCEELAEKLDMDCDDFYFSVKHLRMARFF
jgi:hypothetical protein